MPDLTSGLLDFPQKIGTMPMNAEFLKRALAKYQARSTLGR